MSKVLKLSGYLSPKFLDFYTEYLPMKKGLVFVVRECPNYQNIVKFQVFVPETSYTKSKRYHQFLLNLVICFRFTNKMCHTQILFYYFRQSGYMANYVIRE